MAGVLLPDNEIQGLIELVSNTTEAYTAALFLASENGQPLKIVAHQSLSRNINPQVLIGPGDGLIGWVSKNKKPVNVNKFDQDTRRLLFYRIDESIKSFMAVPLIEFDGVLAVDSKQRYVFTEKSQKILSQFGQVIEMALKRIQVNEEGRRRAEAMNFLNELEGTLYHPDQPAQYLRRTTSLLRKYVGADACFLAGILPDDPEHYQLIAHDTHRTYRLRKDLFKTDRGLMGWVMRERMPLIMERARLGTDKSYIFYPEEPFHNFAAFAGLPLVWGNRLQGAVCLTGRESFNIDESMALALEMATDRLAATMKMEHLFFRSANVDRLDPQTDLINRSEFCRRVARMLEEPAIPPYLIILKIENLETIFLKQGQEAADLIMKTAAQYLQMITEELSLIHI